MKSAAPGLSVLLLTEDGGSQADEVLRSLVVKLLGCIEPGAVTREHARAWEPASPEAREVARANSWKNPRRRDLVSFRQYIASKLQRERGFVLFHVDGDRPYRERATSENTRKFETMIRKPVRIILEGPPPQRRARAEPPEKRDSTEVEQRLGNSSSSCPTTASRRGCSRTPSTLLAIARASRAAAMVAPRSYRHGVAIELCSTSFPSPRTSCASETRTTPSSQGPGIRSTRS